MLLIITLPLLATSISGLFGRYIGYKNTKLLILSLLSISFSITLYYYYDIMILNNEYTLSIGKWINIESLQIDWSFTLDKLTITLLIPVQMISLLVYLYAYSYMNHDPHQIRFFSYLALFTFFMIILVTGDNYLILFIGWEFVGVASYLLISFWFTRIQAMKSALTAILLNRMGDAVFIISIALMINIFNSVDYCIINSLVPYIDTDLINWLMLAFLIAASAKSAQLGLHSWLLQAMEGPTPVSALLHSSTMVVAGIYLLIRSSAILEYSPTLLLIILWLGGITTIMAGLIAIVSNDIKRVIALSTMSQLAMMIIAIGVSNYNLSLFHLFCHSFFKALLFMSAGSIIHATINESQDMRLYGSYLNYLPFTYVTLLIGSLSLMALPSLTGYYSKDIIIESMIGNYSLSGFIIYWFTLLSATLTGLYSIRIIYLTFLNIPNASKTIYLNIKENDYILSIPMIILTLCSIFIGYITRDIYLGIGHEFLFTHPNNITIIETEFGIPTLYKLLPLILSLSCSFILLYLYEFNTIYMNIYNNTYLKGLYIYLNQKIMFDHILNNLVIRGSLSLGQSLNTYIDQGLLKTIGSKGIHSLSTIITTSFNRYATGSLYDYALYILLTIIIVIIYLISPLNILYLIILLIGLFIL